MENIKLYRYRWVVLAAFFLITMAVEIQWLTFAPIARAAQFHYRSQLVEGSLFNIDFLSMIYMFVFLILCIPASYIIDTYGIKKGIALGALIAGVSALGKGLFADNFKTVLLFQTGLAIAQPFILNSVTAVTVRWFPLNERGTAAGLAALAQYLGIIIVMIATPFMIRVGYGEAGEIVSVSGMNTMLLIYGAFTFVSGLAAALLIREKPPTAPSNETIEKQSFVKGIKRIFGLRDMQLLLILFFIGLGLFNAVSTVIDSICAAKGLSMEQSGLTGGIMLLGGIIGALIIPVLSDKMRKRKIFLQICMIGMLPSVAGLAFFTSFAPLMASSFFLGFFVMSAGPLGFQYAAEVSSPAPESTSQGVILLSGQISGLIFVAQMNTEQGIKLWMMIFVALTIAAVFLTSLLKESPMIVTEAEKYRL
ncbi:MFS transporter [Spirochaeta isovalerica]|uniref:MFS family permease n=1 Tax=Spirochaeta isovalerica TaxID=150 RepID=A0A841RC71_9SPIO|nr:MFS transporter [Spirochaeta isovalerica]MBB6481585.1 MFS family permease [Spirochaeta isovalerica]